MKFYNYNESNEDFNRATIAVNALAPAMLMEHLMPKFVKRMEI
jgi:hypothetical protein